MMRGHYVEVEGAGAFVEEWGQGPTVLCLHTAGQSGVQWRRAGPALAELGWRVLIPDLPGHGRSEPAPGGPIRDLGQYGAWCRALLRQMGAERPAVVG